MRTGIKAPVIVIVFLMIALIGRTQSQEVSWEGEVLKKGEKTFLVFHADIKDGWHLYSTELPSEEGPLPTEFRYEESDQFKPVGKIIEEEAIEKYDPNFMVDVLYFQDSAKFMQEIERTSDQSFNATATVTFMVCNDEMCMPPVDVEIKVPVE